VHAIEWQISYRVHWLKIVKIDQYLAKIWTKYIAYNFGATLYIHYRVMQFNHAVHNKPHAINNNNDNSNNLII